MRNKRSKKEKIKLRASTRAFYIIIALVLFAISSNNIFQELTNNTQEKLKKEIYTYTNNYKSTYTMNIVNNRFIEEKTLPMGQTYVTDLLKSMDVNIKYKYEASKKTSIKYSYNVTATIGASYTDDGKEYKVWEKKYTLLEDKTGESDGDFSINEIINVDLQKYNKEVNDFKQTMGMALDAYLNVQLNVITNTEVQNKKTENKYSSDLKLTLGSKITNVESEKEDVKKGSLEEENAIVVSRNKTKIAVNTLLFAVSVYALYYIAKNTRVARNIKNEYKLELNRILKSCQDKIIMVTKKIDVEEDNVIDVKDIVELIKLSEELYKPILYWNSDNEQEAWFCVISNSMTYRFILKKY